MMFFPIDQDKSYVYVLKLKARNKYYVGFSSDLTNRLKKHIEGKGAEFTKKHGVETLVALVECSDVGRAKEIETTLTDFYKKAHGSKNVRGAGHTDSRDKGDTLTHKEVKTSKLEKKTKTVKPHTCIECGRPIRHKGKCMGCNIRAKRERERQA
jgi:predicted GIY-YIG superfamily endonuclease